MSAPEFSHPLRMDQASDTPQPLKLSANAEERAALARRFGLIALDRLEGKLRWWREGETIRLDGQISATLAQACVVTGEPVPATLDEALAVRFLPESAPEADEIELDAMDCDDMEFDGLSADAGEAVAQSLALALDPYPRAAGAEDMLRKAGVLREEEAGAFGALAGLRDQLARK